VRGLSTEQRTWATGQRTWAEKEPDLAKRSAIT
jgi:hypothetical protein